MIDEACLELDIQAEAERNARNGEEEYDEEELMWGDEIASASQRSDGGQSRPYDLGRGTAGGAAAGGAVGGAAEGAGSESARRLARHAERLAKLKAQRSGTLKTMDSAPPLTTRSMRHGASSHRSAAADGGGGAAGRSGKEGRTRARGERRPPKPDRGASSVALFAGLERGALSEIDLKPVAAAAPSQGGFQQQLESLTLEQLRGLLLKLGRPAAAERPSDAPLTASLAAVLKGELTAAVQEALAEAPLALIDEIVFEIQAR